VVQQSTVAGKCKELGLQLAVHQAFSRRSIACCLSKVLRIPNKVVRTAVAAAAAVLRGPLELERK
jgi:hypothetical protein